MNDQPKLRERAPLFQTGHVVATPAFIAGVMLPFPRFAIAALRRHVRGEWGDVDDADARANDSALLHAARLLSAYKAPNGVAFWIITEADRSATTFLLPSEY